MKKFNPEAIYYSLPVLLQNLLVSLKGYQLQKIRTGGKYSSFRNEIRQRNSWTREQFEDYQLTMLNLMVEKATNSFPYYKKLFSDQCLTDIYITTVDDVLEFPILNKKDIKDNPDGFISRSNKENLLAVNTTGTTGSPLEITCDSRGRQKNYAFFDEYLLSIGIDSAAPHIVIGGRVIIRPECIDPPFWRFSAFQHSLLMSSYHLSDQFLGSYVDKIRDFNPEYIESYPSSIYRISQYMMSRGIKLQCKAVITSAETLLPEQRATIESAFRCKVFDQYGCAEMTVFAAQCLKGHYHIRPDYGLLELVDDEGKPVPYGKEGNVICTGLINEAMPLIRYAQGDIAAFGDACDCGLNTPILKYIKGRKDDVIYTSDGRSVGRLSPVLKGFPVESVQYIQREIGKLEVLIVPEKDFNSATIPEVENALRQRVGQDMEIQFKVVDTILKGKGGKQLAVISLIDEAL